MKPRHLLTLVADAAEEHGSVGLSDGHVELFFQAPPQGFGQHLGTHQGRLEIQVFFQVHAHGFSPLNEGHEKTGGA